MAGDRRPDPDFWRGRSVFLTGHTGFVGGWLAFWLARMGAQVTGYSLAPPTEPCFFNAVGLQDAVAGTINDVCDLPLLTQAIVAAKPRVLLHLAAQPLIGVAFHEPYATFATNVLGTLNVLEAASAASSLEAVVVFTTDKVYAESGAIHPFREDDPLGGVEPYALSKASTEFAVRAYRGSRRGHGHPEHALVTIRAGNIVGGGDWAADRLVPDAVRAFVAAAPLVLRKPDAVRPWQFVLDAVEGLLLLAEAACGDPRTFSGAWNFGPLEHARATVADVADALVRYWGPPANWRTGGSSGIAETLRLEINSSKAANHLGWKPRWPLEAALKQTIAWYHAFYAGVDMRAMTSKQIDEHYSTRY
jgi:CDP-glucose 4,6-dehydratase